jgi:hypothetical protein
MEGGAIGEAAASGRGDGDGPGRVRVQLFVRGDVPGEASAGLVESMLERDHEVIVAVCGDRGLRRGDRRALAELASRYPGLDRDRVPDRIDPWRIPAGAIRRGLDYLRCLEPEDPDAQRLRDEARERAPRLLRALLRVPPFRWQFGRRMLAWLLRRTEAGLPIARAPKALIAARSPDVVVVTAGGELGDPQPGLVRAARATRTPSVLIFDAAAEGGPARLRDVPTLTVATDQAQVNAIVRMHGLPRERVKVAGAQSADGSGMPAGGAVVEALDEAARSDEVPRPPGRLLRPFMWLLTPVALLAVALLRPSATIKDVRKRRKLARKRAMTEDRIRERQRTADRKARAKAAKREKRGRGETQGQRKRARADEKQRKRAGRAAERQQKQERRAARAASETQEEGQ